MPKTHTYKGDTKHDSGGPYTVVSVQKTPHLHRGALAPIVSPGLPKTVKAPHHME